MEIKQINKENNQRNKKENFNINIWDINKHVSLFMMFLIFILQPADKHETGVYNYNSRIKKVLH